MEAHTIPGGQCTSWKRKGYTIDGCIHHLFGCDPRLALYHLWEELGAMPCEMVTTADYVSVLGSDGTLFSDYYDLDRLREHMLALAPEDRAAIDRYLKGIQIAGQKDLFGSMMLGGLGDKVALLPTMAQLAPYLRLTLDQFAVQFKSELLRRAFPLLECSLPGMPLLLHLVKHAYGAQGGIRWPVGGARAFAQSIARRYTELGGAIHYGSHVTEILTENDRAVGVRLQDGTEERADYVISNADGRKTIRDLLRGQFTNDQIRHGFANMPKKPFDVTSSILGTNMNLTLPGLSHFYFAGAWATSAGALFMNALSGKRVLQRICRQEGRRFTASTA